MFFTSFYNSNEAYYRSLECRNTTIPMFNRYQNFKVGSLHAKQLDCFSAIVLISKIEMSLCKFRDATVISNFQTTVETRNNHMRGPSQFSTL